MTDPAEIRAEGRRLLADFYDLGPEDDGFRQDKLTDFLFDHLGVLLADPAPVGLTEKELRLVSDARELAPPNPDYPIPWDRYLLARLVAIIDRLSPGVAEPPHVTHIFKAGGLYGWGCSCGESDGTHETRALAVQGADWHKVHGVAGRCACGFPERHTNLPCSR